MQLRRKQIGVNQIFPVIKKIVFLFGHEMPAGLFDEVVIIDDPLVSYAFQDIEHFIIIPLQIEGPGKSDRFDTV